MKVKYRVNAMKDLIVELIKQGRTKSKIKILEDYPPHIAGEELRVLNKRLLGLKPIE